MPLIFVKHNLFLANLILCNASDPVNYDECVVNASNLGIKQFCKGRLFRVKKFIYFFIFTTDLCNKAILVLEKKCKFNLTNMVKLI